MQTPAQRNGQGSSAWSLAAQDQSLSKWICTFLLCVWGAGYPLWSPGKESVCHLLCASILASCTSLWYIHVPPIRSVSHPSSRVSLPCTAWQAHLISYPFLVHIDQPSLPLVAVNLLFFLLLTSVCLLAMHYSPTLAGRPLRPGPAGPRSGWWTPWGMLSLSLLTPGSSLHAWYVPSFGWFSHPRTGASCLFLLAACLSSLCEPWQDPGGLSQSSQACSCPQRSGS